MAQTIACPSCNRQYAVKPELAGKRAKCKCGGRIEFPPDSLGEADLLDDEPAAVRSGASRPQFETLEAPCDPYELKSAAPAASTMPPPVQSGGPPALPSAQCRNCRSPLAPGAVLCTRCGMNQQTGSMMRTMVAAPARPMATPQPAYAPRRSVFGGGRSGTVNILVGAVLLIIGLAVTVGTFSAAANGGTYVVAFGPILFGGFRLVRGIGQMMSGE